MTTRLRGDFFGQDRYPYHPHQGLVAAANTALLLGVPLLLTGEPGCGKTDFAWAAARKLGREPLCCYVRSDTRARDLLYHYDAVRRFADAQGNRAEEAARPQGYIDLMPLGQALLAPQQEVVLIDEIDKAPRDLPNDLLRELDQGHFDIPEIPPDAPLGPALGAAAGDDLSGVRLQRRMQRQEERPMPLVIITSNQERQLPDPFLRRCVFFHIPFPAWPDEAPPKPGEPPRKDTLLAILRGRLPALPAAAARPGAGHRTTAAARR